MRLAKAGYGDIKVIKSLDVKTFFDLVHYDNYINEYKNEFERLNCGK